MNTKITQNPTNKSRVFFRPKTFMLLAFVALSLVVVSCKKQQPEPQNNIEKSFIIDRSLSTSSNLTSLDSIDRIIHTVISSLHLDASGNTSFGCKVRITSIGTSIRPEVYTIVLPPGDSWLGTNGEKRKQVVQRFRKQLLAALQLIYKQPADQSHSQVYLTMCQELNALSSSQFGTSKTLYLITDGIQSDGSIEFIKYLEDLKMFKATFPQLKSQMIQQCPLPDLSNIQIMMANRPHHSSGEFILTCDQFWKELIQEHKGNLIIKGSINY